VVLAAAVVAAMALGPAAGAETPTAVRDGMGDSGVWVADGSADRQALEAAVARARQAGVDLAIVVARDPQPDATSFALRVRQLGVGDPVLVFGPDGELGVSSEQVEWPDLVRAREAAQAARSPEAAAEAFTSALLAEPERAVPETVRLVVTALFVAVGVLGVATMAEHALRLARRRRRRPASGAPQAW
jgi:hypothetical protein